MSGSSMEHAGHGARLVPVATSQRVYVVSKVHMLARNKKCFKKAMPARGLNAHYRCVQARVQKHDPLEPDVETHSMY